MSLSNDSVKRAVHVQILRPRRRLCTRIVMYPIMSFSTFGNGTYQTGATPSYKTVLRGNSEGQRSSTQPPELESIEAKLLSRCANSLTVITSHRQPKYTRPCYGDRTS